MELVLELSGCNLKYLASKKKIQEFINGICKEIKMEKYGPSYINRFPGGDLWDVGYSFFQFITTSSITGHFIEPDRIAFINIFSCNAFNSKKAGRFAKNFFQARKLKNRLIIH